MHSNEELCIKKEKLCIKIDEFCRLRLYPTEELSNTQGEKERHPEVSMAERDGQFSMEES